MRKFISIIVVLVCWTTSSYADTDINARWREANAAYAEGDYLKASQLYSRQLDSDFHNSELYFNLANCYYKMDMLAEAILNYNRALLISPSDEDIIHNLQIAETQTTNRIEKMPEFFLYSWLKTQRDSMSSDQWACASLVLLALTLAATLLFYFSRKTVIRKIMFWSALVLLCCFVMSLAMSISQRNSVVNNMDAIVMNNAVAVKSSPMNDGTDLFVLNQGAKVEVIEQVGEWIEVKIQSGNTGWLRASTIEMINPQSKL